MLDLQLTEFRDIWQGSFLGLKNLWLEVGWSNLTHPKKGQSYFAFCIFFWFTTFQEEVTLPPFEKGSTFDSCQLPANYSVNALWISKGGNISQRSIFNYDFFCLNHETWNDKHSLKTHPINMQQSTFSLRNQSEGLLRYDNIKSVENNFKSPFE